MTEKVDMLIKMKNNIQIMAQHFESVLSTHYDNVYNIAKYQQTNHNLQTIIDLYNIYFDSDNCINSLEKCKTLIKKIQYQLNNCCNHHFVNDDIVLDLELDNYTPIRYCTICEVTESYYNSK